ncbi:crossover junction endodeoxyribonuclease RuvC [Synechococcus sp. CBW1004]|nr:crossover junction endodeoxyribonuclease RuvC [Synechococcus sp. CBW1004]
MVILGIDPGLAIVGYGVIEVAEGPQGRPAGCSQRLLDCGMIRTDPGRSEGDRMVEIASDLRQLIRAWRPRLGAGDAAGDRPGGGPGQPVPGAVAAAGWHRRCDRLSLRQ